MAEQQAGTEQPQQQFAMQRIYTKDISFEAPMSPGVFREKWTPKVAVDLNTKSGLIDEELFLLLVSATIITLFLTPFLVRYAYWACCCSVGSSMPGMCPGILF